MLQPYLDACVADCAARFMQAGNPAAGHAGLLDIPSHTVVLDMQAPYSSSDDILTAAVKQQVRNRLTSQEYEASRVWAGVGHDMHGLHTSAACLLL
jgi:hypothetical protein